MAYQLRDHVRAPAAAGWVRFYSGLLMNDQTISLDKGPKRYTFVAYKLDSENTYFGGRAGTTTMVNGVVVHHGIVTAVNQRQLPPKPDYNVWAISEVEFVRLQALERLWWRDYDMAVAAGTDTARAMDFAHHMVLKQQRM
ncbi:hypothetical protein BCR39DRAFT_551813 [Naematelia encephala]|uniref:Uncharacterized protein n=1 Tax=Naematelia encephala TaxID=71784 RepID=A0A1Y2AJF1_9TREE|nr:hypothetical protein BCR39DRAFT_551813 [Naematelia encephala]